LKTAAGNCGLQQISQGDELIITFSLKSNFKKSLSAAIENTSSVKADSNYRNYEIANYPITPITLPPV
jgi:hypothetical protein